MTDLVGPDTSEFPNEESRVESEVRASSATMSKGALETGLPPVMPPAETTFSVQYEMPGEGLRKLHLAVREQRRHRRATYP
jgi:hypothetical protein